MYSYDDFFFLFSNSLYLWFFDCGAFPLCVGSLGKLAPVALRWELKHGPGAAGGEVILHLCAAAGSTSASWLLRMLKASQTSNLSGPEITVKTCFVAKVRLLVLQEGTSIWPMKKLN